VGLGGVVRPGGADSDHQPAVVGRDLADHELDAERQVLDRVVERVAVGRVGAAQDDPVTGSVPYRSVSGFPSASTIRVV
jgi:hypothetical protein